MDLSFNETRVLGVLIEKSLSQPAYYPMTVNSITNACNQKTNREPVTDLSESEVSSALSMLRRRDLAQQAEPEPNSRSVKFRHNIETNFGWNAAQRALMAELFLRGPLTLAELRAKASRMTHLESNDYARDLLSEFEKNEPPLVEEMDREPGRTARRFRQLMGAGAQSSTAAPVVVESVAPAATTHSDSSADELRQRVAQLEADVRVIKEQLKALRNAD